MITTSLQVLKFASLVTLVDIGTSEYICYFRPHAKQIAELITAFFLQQSPEKKVSVFCIIHEIFIRSKDQVCISYSHSLHS